MEPTSQDDEPSPWTEVGGEDENAGKDAEEAFSPQKIGRSKKTKGKKEPKKEEPKECQFDKYEFTRIHRSEIKNAEYNPRKITDAARKQLRDNLKRIGLTHPITWNKRTGNILSGHQRISILDSLERTQNYTLRVAVVDMDEKSEREQNVFENNPASQGYFDVEKLEAVIKTPEFSIDNAGIDRSICLDLFGDGIVEGQSAEELEELAAKLRGAQERLKGLQGKSKEKHRLDFYRVLVFKDAARAAEYAECIGHGPDEIFLEGERAFEPTPDDDDAGDDAGESIIQDAEKEIDVG